MVYVQKDTVHDAIASVFVAAFAIFVAAMFIVYDTVQYRRNKELTAAAARSNALLSTVFPKQIRDKLDQALQEKDPVKNSKSLNTFFAANHAKSSDNQEVESPIADLFPETTVLFADIAGFTAWASVREPTQVFILLETIYHAFDQIANRRHVFKVETVGDCYVAVTGLPTPRKDHAVVMARFAKDCMAKCRTLVKKLEVTLGPDTGDLQMRMGMHSGPVTAGVLRGDRSRFQLFGDTMNTASRMESTGSRGRIQVSQDTANLLTEAGRGHWLASRKEQVIAKGKGEMQTYWLVEAKGSDSRSASLSDSSENKSSADETEGQEDSKFGLGKSLTCSKKLRLIEWNVDVLLRLLKQIVARRLALLKENPNRVSDADESIFDTDKLVIDEVTEIVELPAWNYVDDSKVFESLHLQPQVVEQLYQYVASIAEL
jgi:class 3 adenylate cyclase